MNKEGKKCSTHCDWPNCTLPECVAKGTQSNDEDELWEEVEAIVIGSPTPIGVLKSKFIITRKR